MTLTVQRWPQDIFYTGKPPPADARVTTGVLAVPPDCRPGVLSDMEQRFRSTLWPPCKADGYLRMSREFLWESGGHFLYYRIVDVPPKAKK